MAERDTINNEITAKNVLLSEIINKNIKPNIAEYRFIFFGFLASKS